MSKVHNWQLGREMAYPYEAAWPERQFAFVININRCLGCQTCTMACKSTWTFSRGQEHMWWTNVETKPYGGYPHGWDLRTLDLLEEADPGGERWTEAEDAVYGQSYVGPTIFEAGGRADPAAGPNRVRGYLPADEEWRTPNLYEDVPASPQKGVRDRSHPDGTQLPGHKTWFFYLARLCNHCSYPACLAACPRKAIYKRPEDGIVLIDQNRCRGYRKCVEACPYKKSMYRPTTRVSEKCVACYPRVEGRDPETGGARMETRCMAACIGHVRLQGLVAMDRKTGAWKEDRQHPLYFLVHVAKVALPLYPQFGTEPNGYYIPPRWAPRPYLRQMFGPGVDHAIEAYSRPDRELLAVLQLFRKSNRIIYRYEIEEGPLVYEREVRGQPVRVYDDTVIAFGEKGEELFRIRVEEPFHVREKDRINWL
jgi:nitrate reductase beta subunit